ncbi:hypothetical protein GF376_02215 [Candidatus Peregrinibacteria bacterium]|nr:hypothetical protein [Candidatus Peregrinibacteria bacterium]
MYNFRKIKVIVETQTQAQAQQQTKKINPDILKPLRQMSLIFFMIIGFTHIITGLMVSNDMLTEIANLINKVLDIPFAMIGIVFALSHIRIPENSNKKNVIFSIMGVISLSVLGLMLYINLFLPDKVI